jgi:hypothetical protein
MSRLLRFLFLSRRRLVLANLVLGALFVLAAICAARPFIARPGDVVGAARLAPGRSSSAEAPLVRLATLDEYRRMITLNDVFAPKVSRPPVVPPAERAPEDPKWTLVGAWEADDGGWQAAISDTSPRQKAQELVVREGTRLRTGGYAAVITEVTEDFVRFEICSSKHRYVYERVLTWSGIRPMGRR